MKDWLAKGKDTFAALSDKKRAGQLVIVLGLLGMVLILVSELFPGTGADTQTNTDETQSATGVTSATATTSTEALYRAELEMQLTALIEQMDGAGQTAVMITLVSSEEVIYAQDVNTSDTQSSQSHVLLEDGSALAETTLTPEVCGVAVLCQGGDDIIVVAKITNLVTALFDISSTRVSVEKLGG